MNDSLKVALVEDKNLYILRQAEEGEVSHTEKINASHKVVTTIYPYMGAAQTALEIIWQKRGFKNFPRAK